MVSEHIEEIEREVWARFNEYFPDDGTEIGKRLRSKALVILIMAKEMGVQGHADNIKSKEIQ